MLCIAWQYLTGRAVATDPVDRRRAEWPPHPDRVFQALVAAWGERGEAADERAALEWLCGLPAPEITAPPAGPEADDSASVFLPNVVKVFVPVNDIEGPKRGAYGEAGLGLLPAHRPRKERFFPGVVVGDAVCALRWPGGEPPEGVRQVLSCLVQAVSYLGHSSSLVRMWLADDPPLPTWVPSDEGSRRRDITLRVADADRLDVLVRAYAGGGEGWKRPPTARWRAYARHRPGPSEVRGHFDDRLLVFRQVGGDRLGLSQTLAVTEALRASVIPHATGPALEILSGHLATGAPSNAPHAAYLPLADLGHDHADGHLLGVAVALPGSIDAGTESSCVTALASLLDPERRALRLVMGRAGAVDLRPDESPAPPASLRPSTWCRPARRWASVTPIVLDRFPPRRHADEDSSASGFIADSCERQGLPRPEEVAILQTSAHLGAPPARAFPALARKGDGARRWHVHAVLRFAEDVRGPLLLGAGRYRGYGLCRPLPGGVS